MSENSKQEEAKYLTTEDNSQMGLNNKLCKNPVAYFLSKKVNLSVEDLIRKKCFLKPTVDLIGEAKCKWLHPYNQKRGGCK